MLVWLPYYTRPPRRNTCARDGGPTTISFQITLIAIVEFFEVSLLRVFFLHFCHLSHAGVVHHEEVHLKVVRASSLDLKSKLS